jgi:flagellar hook-associated protein 3 FlgL
VEPVRPHGTYDVFSALISIRDAVLNDRNVSDSQQRTLLDQAIGELSEATSGISQAMTSNGAQLQAMSDLKQSTKNMSLTTQQQANSLENADIVDVATDLARRQVLYESSLATAAKLLSMSLLNYM